MLGYKFTPEEYEQRVKEYNTIDLIYHKAKRGVKAPDVIRCKVQYLQHIIIRRANSKKDLESFRLNSQITQTSRTLLSSLRQEISAQQ